MQKLRVGVLMGGKSIEKEVSFNSGRTICDHLDTARYTIIPIFQRHDGNLFILPWHFLHRGKISDFEHRLNQEAQKIVWDDLKKHVDFIYIATHGRYAEDGTLQGFLEVLGIPYLGSGILASSLRMDKIIHKKILERAGITLPKYLTIHPNKIDKKNENALTKKIESHGLSFPVVVKPYNEGSSLGISVVYDKKELHTALATACYIEQGKKKTVIIEEKLSGMEFSCITLVDYKTGDYLPLPPTEIVLEKNTHFFDYEQKYMPGKATKFTPARCSKNISKKIQETCIQVMKALEFTTISRIDGFVTPDGRVVIIDPNTLSGMAPSSFIFNQAAEIGMSHIQLINHLIETELQQYGMLDAILKEERKEAKKMNRKIRVAVLLGGRSNEKEISLESGRNIVYKLSPQKYDAIPIFVNQHLELYQLTQSQLVRNSTKEIETLLSKDQKITWHNLPHIADFVFIGLHGGKGENGAVQGTLEMLGIPYNGSSVLTSGLCMDKCKTAEFLASQGFEIPQHRLVSQDEWKISHKKIINEITEQFSFPIIIKPHDDGCSIMVQKAVNEKELTQAIKNIFAHDKSHAFIEECIVGMELTVGVIGNEHPQALPPSQAIAQQEILSIEEKFLPGTGENQTPAPLSAQTLTFVKKTIERAYQALGCKGYARIDCFYQSKKINPTKKERVVILEINTLPGMTPATCIFHQAAEIGLKPMDFIDTIIQLGFDEHCNVNTSSVNLAKILHNNIADQ